MENAEQPDHLKAIARAKRVHLARAAGPSAAAEVEASVAGEILGRPVDANTICQGGLSPFEAAETIAAALAGALGGLAFKTGRKPPVLETYSPLHASASTFRSIWKLREVIDALEIPYDFYVFSAVELLGTTARMRAPRPSRLCAPDVVSYVCNAWVARNVRAHQPDDGGACRSVSSH